MNYIEKDEKYVDRCKYIILKAFVNKNIVPNAIVAGTVLKDYIGFAILKDRSKNIGRISKDTKEFFKEALDYCEKTFDSYLQYTSKECRDEIDEIQRKIDANEPCTDKEQDKIFDYDIKFMLSESLINLKILSFVNILSFCIYDGSCTLKSNKFPFVADFKPDRFVLYDRETYTPIINDKELLDTPEIIAKVEGIKQKLISSAIANEVLFPPEECQC